MGVEHNLLVDLHVVTIEKVKHKVQLLSWILKNLSVNNELLQQFIGVIGVHRKVWEQQ